MKLHYLLAFFACAALVGCSEKEDPQAVANQPVRLVLEHGTNGGADKFFAIRQGDKELFTYLPTHWIGVMKKSDAPAEKTFRADYALVDDMLNYKDCLLDVKGDGDARYLIVVDSDNYTGSTCTGWLVDTKDNFAIVGAVPAGKNYDYPVPNPELVFVFTENIMTFADGTEANICVPLKIAKGAGPVLAASDAAAPLRFNPAKYRNLPKEQGVYALYCDLMSKGQLMKVGSAAKFIGFTDTELKQYGDPCMEKILKSKFASYLVELNKLPFPAPAEAK